MISVHFTLPVVSCLLLTHLIRATLVNTTVDDGQVDLVQCWPPTLWLINGSTNGSMPDPRRANNGTWQFISLAADSPPANANVTTQFNGSAVYVYAILQREMLTAASFLINGTMVDSYSHIPMDGDAFQYNVSIFSNSSLPYGQHTLAIVPSTNESSVMYFDYLVYSTREAVGQILSPPAVGNDDAPLQIVATSTSSTPSSTWMSPAPGDPMSIPPWVDIMTPTSSLPPVTPLAPVNLPISSSSTSASPSLGVVGGVTSSTTAAPNVTPSPSKATENLAAIIGATVGGLLLLGAALGLLLFCRHRRQQARQLRVNPFLTPVPSPNATQDEFSKPASSPAPSSPHPYLARLSFQTVAESMNSGITLTDEIFPLPSEMEDVYSQLEALSAEVQGFQLEQSATSSSTQGTRKESSRSKAARTVQARIEQLHADVLRMRRRSISPTSAGHQSGSLHVGRADPVSMLNDLAVVRAEIEEMLIEQMSVDVSDIERLPSYHSRKARQSFTPELPPPLPIHPKHG